MIEKECYRCHVVKPLTEFHKRKSRKDGHTEICKPCKKEYSQQRYLNNEDVRAASKKQSAEARERNRKYVYNILKNSSCIDCGINQWEVLEFDHVRGIKSHGICYMIMHHFPLLKIRREIDKCDIRCANCHRLKTMKQFGWARATW